MSENSHNSDFPVTRWTLIRKAQRSGDADAVRAMNEICRAYWYPIYAYARRFGLHSEDAEDVTQDFFQNFITYDSLQATHEDKGRLRNFMLAMLKRVISKRLRHDSAEKRGSSKTATLSLDDADTRYALEPADGHDPDSIFDQAWARDVLARAESRLRDEYARADNTTTFDQLCEFLPLGDNATPYAEAAQKLGVREATLRLQIHRMRKRYARLIEAVIAETVSDESEQKAELEYLMRVIGT